MRRDVRWVVLLALAPSLARAAEGTEAAVKDPAEWQAYQDTLERYRDRSKELLDEARTRVEQHEAEQRAAQQRSFEQYRETLESSENLLRKQAETRIEAFLRKYKDSPETADMQFRLADLYFEDAELEFYAADQQYQKLEEQADSNPSLVLPPPPTKNYARSIELYRAIIASSADYANLPDTYYMLAWCLGAQNATQYDLEGARAVYETIAAKYPKTPFSNDANMWLGEYWFDQPGPRTDPLQNVPTAIAYYQTVLADGPAGRNYDESIYKLGWSYFKMNNFDQALAYLVKLLDYSDEQFLRTGRVSNMRPEAVEYLAISYADMADRTGKRPVDVAQAHLRKLGEKKWEHDVVERLAEILLVQAKSEEAIETFAFLQDHWPLDPKNPVYQQRIAVTWDTKAVPDHAKAAEAIAKLSERYGEGSAWYEANKSNPDAIAAARGFIERSLAAVAVDYLARAQESGSVEDYAFAAKKFDEFLNSFPLAGDYDLYEWYRALSYYGSRQYAQAEAAYGQILKNDRSPYRDGSRFQIMKCREEILLAKYGRIDALPQDAVVEQVVTGPDGKQRNRYVIGAAHQGFINAADDLASREFAPGEWAAALEDARPALLYLPGQILYVHGRYAEARDRFDKLIAAYPRTDEAVYASSLYVNSLVAEGDLAAVRLATSRFLGMNLGKNPEINKVNLSELTDIREQAAFGIALEYVKKEDRAAAAKAFTDFMKEYPTSKFYKEALYNAANSNDLAGNAGEAIRQFEQYVQRYPADAQSQFLYTRIAEAYSSTLELQKAIQNYDTLVRTFPDSPDAPAAIYNASFLRVGLGDHANAARGYERYGTQFPDSPDAEEVYFRAGAQWELVGANEALDYYGRYLKRYPTQNPSHAIEALERTAALALEKRDTRRADAAYAQIQQVYAAAGGNVTEHARSLAAKGALNDLMRAYEAFKTVKWSTNEAKNVEILTKTKAEERKAIDDRALGLIATYKDFETAAAALYIQGMSFFAYADMAYDVPPPKGLSEDEIDIYRQTVDERFRLPAEDRGKARLVQALDKARAEKRWSEWNTKALVELHDRYPSEFPSERQESRGGSASGDFPFGAPVDAAVAPASGAK